LIPFCVGPKMGAPRKRRARFMSSFHFDAAVSEDVSRA